MYRQLKQKDLSRGRPILSDISIAFIQSFFENLKDLAWLSSADTLSVFPLKLDVSWTLGYKTR